MREKNIIIIEMQVNKTLEQNLREYLEAILEDDASKYLAESQRLSKETIKKLWDIALEEADSKDWTGLKEEDKFRFVYLSYKRLKSQEIKNNELKADIRRLIENMNGLGLSDIEAQMARIAKVEEAIVNNECALTEEEKENILENLEKIQVALSYFQKYISQFDQKVLNEQDLSKTKEEAKGIEAKLKGYMDYLKRVEDTVAEDAVAKGSRLKKMNELARTMLNMKEMDESQKWRKDIEALGKRLLSAHSSNPVEADKIIDEITHGIKSMLQTKAGALQERIRAIIDADRGSRWIEKIWAIIDADPGSRWIEKLYQISNNLTKADFNNVNYVQEIVKDVADAIRCIKEKEKTDDELLEMLDEVVARSTPKRKEIQKPESSPTPPSSNSNLPSHGVTSAGPIRVCVALLSAFMAIFLAIASGIFAGQEGGQSL